VEEQSEENGRMDAERRNLLEPACLLEQAAANQEEAARLLQEFCNDAPRLLRVNGRINTERRNLLAKRKLDPARLLQQAAANREQAAARLLQEFRSDAPRLLRVEEHGKGNGRVNSSR
jgi:hypothetical protein